jgi:ring-1,2-phenylacetyl-CoA epoxidase subunit PaaD
LVSAAGQAALDDLELRVWEALGAVHDPEIPPISITALGIVERVRVTSEAVEVDLLPTFAGCPALDVIQEDAGRAVEEVAGARTTRVRFVYTPPWTSDRITPEGREALRSYGLAPPGEGPHAAFIPLASFSSRVPQGPGIPCPFCGSVETVVESTFGPTLCRSTHFCHSCRNPFEAFKPKAAETPAG